MDEATIDRLARKAGGRFKLASLVMKRMVDINRGAQPLVEPERDNMLHTVLKEIDLDLIRLVPRLPAPEEEEGGEELAQEE
jgi:DNA-directed RNA polymerase subunit omega